MTLLKTQTQPSYRDTNQDPSLVENRFEKKTCLSISIFHGACFSTIHQCSPTELEAIQFLDQFRFLHRPTGRRLSH